MQRTPPLSPRERLQHLIECCYAAASRDAQWPRFLAALTETFAASASAIVMHGRSTVEDSVLWTDGDAKRRVDQWLPVDMIRSCKAASVSTCVAGTTGENRYLIGSLSEQSAGPVFVVTLRRKEFPPFDDDDSAILNELVPHLNRALHVYRKVQRCENERHLLSEVLDQLPEAVFLVDADARVVMINRSARSVIRGEDGIFLSDNRIAASAADENTELRNTIARIGRMQGRGGSVGERPSQPAQVFSISRPSGTPPYSVFVTPLHPDFTTIGNGTAAVAAVITKPVEPSGLLLTPILATNYRLTPSETRLARLIIDGHSLKGAAERLGITRNTARTHMKRIYTKIGVHSQADLIRLVSRDSIDVRVP